MTQYEKSPRRTNYYQNNGFDAEQWEQWEDWRDEANYPAVREGYQEAPRHYHREDSAEERGHDEVFEDHHLTRLEEERFHDEKDPEDCQPDPSQNVNEEFEKSKPATGWDDKFEQFKNGPFPKK